MSDAVAGAGFFSSSGSTGFALCLLIARQASRSLPQVSSVSVPRGTKSARDSLMTNANHLQQGQNLDLCQGMPKKYSCAAREEAKTLLGHSGLAEFL